MTDPALRPNTDPDSDPEGRSGSGSAGPDAIRQEAGRQELESSGSERDGLARDPEGGVSEDGDSAGGVVEGAIEGDLEGDPDWKPTATGFKGRLERLVNTRWASPVLALLTFADACVSPILPEVLMVPMCLTEPQRHRFYVILCSTASILGGCFGFWLGMEFWDSVGPFFYDWIPGFDRESFIDYSERVSEDTFWWIFAAGFTPLPFKLFTLTAGAMHEQVNFTVFLIAAATSRTLRFWLEVWIIRVFGPKMLDWASRRLKLTLSLLGLVFLVWYLLK